MISEGKDLNTICEIRCLNCKKWFRSDIHFGDSKSFDTTITTGNKTRCPYCKMQTDCNKDNMRFVERNGEGKVHYEEGRYTL